MTGSCAIQTPQANGCVMQTERPDPSKAFVKGFILIAWLLQLQSCAPYLVNILTRSDSPVDAELCHQSAFMRLQQKGSLTKTWLWMYCAMVRNLCGKTDIGKFVGLEQERVLSTREKIFQNWTVNTQRHQLWNNIGGEHWLCPKPTAGERLVCQSSSSLRFYTHANVNWFFDHTKHTTASNSIPQKNTWTKEHAIE